MALLMRDSYHSFHSSTREKTRLLGRRTWITNSCSSSSWDSFTSTIDVKVGKHTMAEDIGMRLEDRRKETNMNRMNGKFGEAMGRKSVMGEEIRR